jgi:hypothetical protein
MKTETIKVVGRESVEIPLSPSALDQLESEIQGSLLAPGDPGWAEAVTVWNGMVAKTPALVLQPASAQDVAAAVTFARDHGLLLSVKGGGHNIAGTSVAEQGLMLDMSNLRGVEVDRAAMRADVGPGCLLGHVDQATQAQGLATVLGFVSETGVAGLTLGGGWGYLTRRFGWTVDNLEEVEIVTADGEIRTANRGENAELFWAVRGGGGNYGVVTRFTFRLHEVGPMVTGGLILWDGRRAGEVLEAYREFTQAAPRELTAAATIRLAPPAPFVPAEWHGKPVVGMLVCYSGSTPEEHLAPIRALQDPVVDAIRPMPYAAQQSMLNAMEPKGLHRYWKTEYLPALPDPFLEAFSENALAVRSPLSQSVIFHLGGALNERAGDDGAVGNRDAQYISGFSGTWPPMESPTPHVDWVRGGWEGIRPFSTGGNYVNFQLAEDDDSRTASAYGTNYERLQRLKVKYDPDNVFRVNRNISPAA